MKKQQLKEFHIEINPNTLMVEIWGVLDNNKKVCIDKEIAEIILQEYLNIKGFKLTTTQKKFYKQIKI